MCAPRFDDDDRVVHDDADRQTIPKSEGVEREAEPEHHRERPDERRDGDQRYDRRAPCL